VARHAFKGEIFKMRVRAKDGAVEVKTVSGVADQREEARA